MQVSTVAEFVIESRTGPGPRKVHCPLCKTAHEIADELGAVSVVAEILRFTSMCPKDGGPLEYILVSDVLGTRHLIRRIGE